MENNTELQLAWQCIEHTGTHLFLTGKAGTGKTTFLKQLKEQSPKRMVVVAPTGIAAINAGGVTIHSFFQLPFAPYVPDSTFTSTTPFNKFGREKIHIIRSMDLLVIDEISMVRADLLDAMDAVLRRYRNRYEPFGGVQLLMIGDMQQLAPVVKEDDWRLLSPYYDTSYFFGSRSLRATEYITIELRQVYRQRDATFLNLLNRIRENTADEAVFDELNKRYRPGFQPKEEDGYIRLTTHNAQAQRYNDRQLTALTGKEFSFNCRIEGTFPEAAYPADKVLTVKKGAQIMFLKNDISGEHRYYNGKIGLVTAVSKDGIYVRGNDDSREFLLEQEEWGNTKYTLNPTTKEITEEVEGTFRQYPIRLAWAITIHKSQGLTFERAIIDANASFAHGQAYVALSRCKSLEGLVLDTPLRKEVLIGDDTIDEFCREMEALTPSNDKLNLLQQRYYYELLREQFDFHQLEKQVAQLLRLIEEHLYRLYPKLLERYRETSTDFREKVVKVSDTFHAQYSAMLAESVNYRTDEALQKRIVSGARYFGLQLKELLLPLLEETKVQTDNKELKKKLAAAIDTFRDVLNVKCGTLLFTEQNGFSVSLYLSTKAKLSITTEEKSAKTERKSRASSQQEKLEVPTEVLHPELYKALIAWRSGEAGRLGLPVYTIIQQKAILGVVNLLPTDEAALTRIPYLGKKGVEKYGRVLLDRVNRYVEKSGVQRPEMPQVSKKSVKPNSASIRSELSFASKTDTKVVSYSLFRQGMTIEEIAKARDLVTGTIATHLEPYVREKVIEINELVAPEKVEKVKRYLAKNSDSRGLTQIKIALGDEISYADARLILAALEKE